MVGWTKVDQNMSWNNYHGSLHENGEWKKKLLEVQEGRTKRWEVGRRDGKNKKKVEKRESEKEDIKVIE